MASGNFIYPPCPLFIMPTSIKSESFFHCTPAERAAFEAGIKLGGLYHQFTGVPVTIKNASTIERAIEDALRAQPFVKAVNVVIDRKMLKERCGGGEGDIGEGYTTLTGYMMEVKLSVAYHGQMAVCGMKFVPELDYPLMYVDQIKEVCWEEDCKV